MFTQGTNSTSGRPSVKSRAISQLQRIRDATRDIFRNLHHTARTGRDEGGGVERAETLANNRDQLVTLLCQLQVDLMENVSNLKAFRTHNKQMEGIEKQVMDRESALREFGKGLKEAEFTLMDGLRKNSHALEGVDGNKQVEIEVDEIVRYAHTISYHTGAQDGWDMNSPLIGALPPAPHVAELSKSRLFRSHRPSKLVDPKPSAAGVPASAAAASKAAVPAEQDKSGASQPKEGESLFSELEMANDSVLGKRAWEEDEMIKIWNRPLNPDDGAAEDHAAGDAMEQDGARPNGDAEPAQKKQFVIQPLSLCLKEKDVKEKEKDIKVPDVENMLTTSVVLPEKPAKWKPGDPIAISPEC